VRANVNTIKGIVFDMDNTLLQSHIDFQAMKCDVASYLIHNGVLPDSTSIAEHTTSTLLEAGRANGLTDEMYEAAMRIAQKHEVAGMEGAGLEAGAQELLSTLSGKYTLVIVTNNSFQAARHALEITHIHPYFDLVIGREQMQALKPSPSGYLAAKRQFPQVQDDAWMSVGDSWMDGRASMEAGIPFISYGGTPEALAQKGVQAVAHIRHLLELLAYV